MVFIVDANKNLVTIVIFDHRCRLRQKPAATAEPLPPLQTRRHRRTAAAAAEP
jgi:hypothetical protein